MKYVLPLLAMGLAGTALAQPRLAPHNVYSSTRGQAGLSTMRRLAACGITTAAEDSNFYDGLAPGFYVGISDPLPSQAAAAAQLAKARGCGVAGQTRMVRRRVAAH